MASNLLFIIWTTIRIIWVFISYIPQAISDCFGLLSPKDVRGQVVLITGAGRGLGRNLAQKFLKLGAKVACVDINSKALEDTILELRELAEKNIEVKSYVCDVSKIEEIQKMCEIVLNDFGRIDIVLNNAGVAPMNSLFAGIEEDIRRTFDINLMASIWMVRELLPVMEKQGCGHFVFTNSMSSIKAIPSASAYSASKAGLLNFANCLDCSFRLNPKWKNIKVTSVLPSYFRSDLIPKEAVQSLKNVLMPLDYTAAQVMHGVLRELNCFTVPAIYGGFSLISLTNLFPAELQKRLGSIIFPDRSSKK